MYLNFKGELFYYQKKVFLLKNKKFYYHALFYISKQDQPIFYIFQFQKNFFLFCKIKNYHKYQQF